MTSRVEPWLRYAGDTGALLFLSFFDFEMQTRDGLVESARKIIDESKITIIDRTERTYLWHEDVGDWYPDSYAIAINV